MNIIKYIKAKSISKTFIECCLARSFHDHLLIAHAECSEQSLFRLLCAQYEIIDYETDIFEDRNSSSVKNQLKEIHDLIKIHKYDMERLISITKESETPFFLKKIILLLLKDTMRLRELTKANQNLHDRRIAELLSIAYDNRLSLYRNNEGATLLHHV